MKSKGVNIDLNDLHGKSNALNRDYKRVVDAARILTVGVPRHIRLERRRSDTTI